MPSKYRTSHGRSSRPSPPQYRTSHRDFYRSVTVLGWRIAYLSTTHCTALVSGQGIRPGLSRCRLSLKRVDTHTQTCTQTCTHTHAHTHAHAHRPTHAHTHTPALYTLSSPAHGPFPPSPNAGAVLVRSSSGGTFTFDPPPPPDVAAASPPDDAPPPPPPPDDDVAAAAP
eukprot:1606617-Rhodomonas_salina.1